MNITKKTKVADILVIDDESINVLIYETLLSKHFNLTCVYNAVEALNIIEKQSFDFILMDINLGEWQMNGVELMKKIRQMNPMLKSKIFAVTAYFENRNMFIAEGFDELYTKPIIKEDILEALNGQTRELILEE
jgi:CheY-like chemotaxis protein